MLQNMRTHCVGRFLIELPLEFRQRHSAVDSAADATFYFGHDADFKTIDVSVVGEGLDTAAFDSRVKQRAETLSVQTNYEKNASMLVAEQVWAPGQILLRYYATPDIADSFVHELHLLVDGAHVVARTKSFDAPVAPAESRLRALVPHVSRVSDPARANGFCLGPVAVSVDSDYEEADLRFGAGAEGQPLMLAIEFSTFGQANGEPSLIERGEANLAGLGVNPKALKKGALSLAGLPAEQWLGRFDEGGARQHGFYAETTGKSQSKSEPKIHLELFTGGQLADGGYAASPLDDEQAMRLWDGIITTLRRR
ncbi:T6SS immunity protein Tli4 family protein [Vulcaniibacterium tengchongense]|uniref:Tle cognate immunity protein 4 C-terminal domain-containing protein n=1 Tax=Vulcaniibacterium tengchongense TaxID=1273429 RepID=A0A3N4V4K5_9GAMM|nr:T6SS immunity protein Tli4 family protein [Vulcaniibacterium tengchongense]RPE74671.1 hypothetical protein EDC50_3081 [Vulcaniibacterium tengchongense]